MAVHMFRIDLFKIMCVCPYPEMMYILYSYRCTPLRGDW